jgi:Membrane domain of glycerophosphoryl diester phosphodiesterase
VEPVPKDDSARRENRATRYGGTTSARPERLAFCLCSSLFATNAGKQYLRGLAESVQICLHALKPVHLGAPMTNADLRPMTLGEVLDRTFTLYRQNFQLFAGIAVFPNLVMLLLRFVALLFTRESAAGKAPNFASSGMLGGAVLGAVGSAALLMVLVGITQAATVSAVSNLFLGRAASVRDAYEGAKGNILTVIGIMILSGLATGVGLILLILPGIYIACRLAVSVPVSVVEQESPISAMERSMELTKGFAGQMFLLLFLVLVLTYVVAMLLQFPVMFFTIAAALAKHPVSLGVTAYSYVAEFASQVIVGPIGTISAALMYYNLRVRKEGFDIQHLMNTLNTAPKPLADTPGIL